jgi:hypothetical protein
MVVRTIGGLFFDANNAFCRLLRFGREKLVTAAALHLQHAANAELERVNHMVGDCLPIERTEVGGPQDWPRPRPEARLAAGAGLWRSRPVETGTDQSRR